MAVQVRPTAPIFMFPILLLLSRNWLSRLTGWLVNRRWPLGLHFRIRDGFIRYFRVDISDAEKSPSEYPTLGDFFIRRLKEGSRPISSSALVSPVDGMLTTRGHLADENNPKLTQIKGVQYSLGSLLGEGWDPSGFRQGYFMTLYLAPWNYHRIHSPVEGKVLRARHIPGFLWPVNKPAVAKVPGLFVRNDRIIVEMECGGGRILVVMVGATNVGRITLDITSELRGNSGAPSIRDWKPGKTCALGKSSGLGCFEMGSTVILILDSHWASRLKPGYLEGGPVPLQVGMGFSE